MTPGELAAMLTAAGVILTALGAWIGHLISSRTVKQTGEQALIDQLQEELARYRDKTDRRLDHLEAENRGYRAFIGVQRDHMAEHGIPLPPWPDGLPR